LALTRRRLFKVAQWLFAAVVLFFAARSLATQWTKLESRLPHIQLGWEWIAAATALILVTYALLIEGWRRVLVAWDSHLPFTQAARIWFLSNLGKYVPGNIWSLTAMGVMAKRRGLSPLAAAGSSVIMQTVSLATGTAIVMVTGAKLLGQPVLVGAAVLVLIALLLAAPRFLPPLVGWVGSLIGREISPPFVPPASIWTAALASALSWLFYGIAFELFVHGLLGKAPGELSSYIAAYTAAYILGFIRSQRVRLTRMDPKEGVTLGPCKVLVWQVELEGDFQSCAKIVAGLENGERLIRIDRLVLEVNAGRLSMTMVVKGLALDVPTKDKSAPAKPAPTLPIHNTGRAAS